ncbi:hypothetical protein HM1_1298 [Heliomicrobium modesticaldum Ice1]|uniref:Uncharacterized protein n=1 Tax=Heliobacterium modesticaldum (strain ATCC 51547 / Ice1) TaxID=498761 RepID=B0TGL8_HELMI|nr:hypothetical protein [Heliomicrobium modesticaldum]ABZ83279.1 hypothetical protein HM1_1298 [Heliomicrobium modesticaldum Ice1]
MDRLTEIFLALRSAFTEPLEEKIRFESLHVELTSAEFFYLAITAYFIGGMVIGYLWAKSKYAPSRQTSSTDGAKPSYLDSGENPSDGNRIDE